MIDHLETVSSTLMAGATTLEARGVNRSELLYEGLGKGRSRPQRA